MYEKEYKYLSLSTFDRVYTSLLDEFLKSTNMCVLYASLSNNTNYLNWLLESLSHMCRLFVSLLNIWTLNISLLSMILKSAKTCGFYECLPKHTDFMFATKQVIQTAKKSDDPNQ